MKKVLILAYDFPPYVSVGGLRPMGWAKYLKQFGIEPIVVTRNWETEAHDEFTYIRPSINQQIEVIQNDEYTVIQTPFKPHLANRLLLKAGFNRFVLIRRLISSFYEIGQFFLPIGNKRCILLGARSYLKQNNDVDLIIATGDPFILFHYAKKLQKEFNVPCLVDYRDPWSQDLQIQKNKVLKTLFSIIEKRTLKNIQYVTTVSDFLIHKLHELHPGKEMTQLLNGFDVENLKLAAFTKQSDEKINIGFVGTITPWFPIELFIQTLCELKKEQQFDFQLNLLGIDKTDYIQNLLDTEYECISENVNIEPKMSNDLMMVKLAQNNLLILFNSFSFLGTKIFDYVAVNRKVLLLFSDDETTKQLKSDYFHIEENHQFSDTVQLDMLNECNAGIAVKNPQHLKELLLDFQEEFSKNKMIQNHSKGFEIYSRQAQTKKLAGIIHQIVSSKS